MKITLYTINDCQFSKQEKEYLKSHNLPFEEKNLETNREFLTEMLAVSNNFAGTPVTKIEKDDGQITVLKGFTKEEFDTALDIATTPNQSADHSAISPPPPQVAETHASVTPPPQPEPKPEPPQSVKPPPPPSQPTPSSPPPSEPPHVEPPAPQPQPLPPIDLPKPPEPPPATPTTEPTQPTSPPSTTVKDAQTDDALNNLLSQLNTPTPSQSTPSAQPPPESSVQPPASAPAPESQTTPQPTTPQPVPPPQNDPALASILNDLQNKSAQPSTSQTKT